VISLATGVWNDFGSHQEKPVYCKTLLNAMRASHLLVHEHPLLILRINDKPISEHSPDFIVLGVEPLIVNLFAAPTITQAYVNYIRACVKAYRRVAGGVLINFGQSQHKYYRSSA
jgi:hypothetical protein